MCLCQCMACCCCCSSSSAFSKADVSFITAVWQRWAEWTSVCHPLMGPGSLQGVHSTSERVAFSPCFRQRRKTPIMLPRAFSPLFNFTSRPSQGCELDQAPMDKFHVWLNGWELTKPWQDLTRCQFWSCPTCQLQYTVQKGSHLIHF